MNRSGLTPVFLSSILAGFKKSASYFVFIAFLFYIFSSSVYALEEKITFYHNDALGSPVSMTDESGNVVWTEDYLPFGSKVASTGSTTNAHTYTGKELDQETGLFYYGARFYDPKIGRFLTLDPYMFGRPKADHLYNPQRLNIYAYALNSPYRYIDPDGRNPIVIAVGLGVLYNLFFPSTTGETGIKSQTPVEFGTDVTIAETFGFGFSKTIQWFKGISTPWERALQSSSMEALEAKSAIKNGAQLYKGGKFPNSTGPEAQYWSLENPFNPGYLDKYGLPEKITKFDFIEVGTLKEGSKFITRESPRMGANLGGGIEAVVEPNSVLLDYFFMLWK